MPKDPTEAARRARIESGLLEASAAIADALGESWTTDELKRDFRVLAFLAPLVLVERKSDGKRGSLEFTHSPRRYFNWREDN